MLPHVNSKVVFIGKFLKVDTKDNNRLQFENSLIYMTTCQWNEIQFYIINIKI